MCSVDFDIDLWIDKNAMIEHTKDSEKSIIRDPNPLGHRTELDFVVHEVRILNPDPPLNLSFFCGHKDDKSY